MTPEVHQRQMRPELDSVPPNLARSVRPAATQQRGAYDAPDGRRPVAPARSLTVSPRNSWVPGNVRLPLSVLGTWTARLFHARRIRWHPQLPPVCAPAERVDACLRMHISVPSRVSSAHRGT